MKVSDLVEALEQANKLFKDKHGVDLEIFGMDFHEDDYDGDMKIQAVGSVEYSDDTFGWGQMIGRQPYENVRIHFECEEGVICDRSVSFEYVEVK